MLATQISPCAEARLRTEAHNSAWLSDNALWIASAQKADMMEVEDANETKAQTLVGKYLQAFASLEQALDAGIGKLLGLEGPKNDIVCSSVPFAKKLGVFFSAEGLLAAKPDRDRKTLLKETRSAILRLNQQRVMFAHNAFITNGDGVTFRRVVADQKLEVSTVMLSTLQVNELCCEALNLAQQVDRLVTEMEPYVPALDFSDPRNSMYIALL